MPSYRVVTTKIDLAEFDVIGMDGKSSGFISHLGLAHSNGSYDSQMVEVIDMAPPLRTGVGNGKMVSHAMGTAELSDDEVRKIKTFIDTHASEHEALAQLGHLKILRRAPEMYCIYPHTSPYVENGKHVRTKFSCAGFVYEAYRAARITLVAIDGLPVVNRSLLKQAYPHHMALIDGGRITAESLGLTGSGPWQILLCGYFFHALDRVSSKIRTGPFAPELSCHTFGSND